MSNRKDLCECGALKDTRSNQCWDCYKNRPRPERESNLHFDGDTKECNKCHKIKPIDEFFLNKNRPNGLYDSCAACMGRYEEGVVVSRQIRDVSWKETGVRACKRCGITRPIDEFYGTSGGNLHSKCKWCELEIRTGWTKEMWEYAYEIQGGLCANVGCLSSIGLVGDHDHETMEPRSLLCGQCNRALGMLKEDVNRISGLLQYAEKCQTARDWLEV